MFIATPALALIGAAGRVIGPPAGRIAIVVGAALGAAGMPLDRNEQPRGADTEIARYRRTERKVPLKK
jgi:hypothetical protein